MQGQENKLMSAFPFIEWLKPQKVTVVGRKESVHVCRFCIALHGLRAEDVANWDHDEKSFRKHMKVVHGIDV